MTPVTYAVVIACAAGTVAALMHAWKSWVTVGTRHDWTNAVNRLGARVTTIDRRVTDLENKEMNRP